MNMRDVITKLLIEQPYYGCVAAAVTPTQTNGVETIKMASIPTLQIFYNPVWFDALPNDQKTGAVIHELLHVILLHQYRRGSREIALWSAACDMAVNEMIPKHLLMKDAVTVEAISKRLKREIAGNRTAEFYYDVISDADEAFSFLQTEDKIVLMFEGAQVMSAARLSDEPASPTEISALKNDIAQLMDETWSQGEVPCALSEEVKDVYREIRINWRVVLKRFLSGRGRMVTRKSYKRQSRRYENLPGTKRSVGVDALLAVDESGSISDEMVKAFFAELFEINKIIGGNFFVTVFDTKCKEPVSLNKFILDSEREKRGGTDYRPVFALADRLKMPLVILFTDGDGQMPDSVNQSTLWVLTKNTRQEMAFGYSVPFER